MPSQICHLIFAEDSLREALGNSAVRILKRYGNIYRFGAQGPDFFYHNQRTKPTGLKFGVNAHREGYGRLVTHMIHELRRLEAKKHKDLPLIRAYILGFTTHAFLDKKTHPFIDYFSGWVDADREETEIYYRCHIFMERILDVLMLKLKRGLKRLTETNETLRRRNAVLVEEINYLRNHGGYLELQAHKLGLVKKGEIVFQFKEDR